MLKTKQRELTSRVLGHRVREVTGEEGEYRSQSILPFGQCKDSALYSERNEELLQGFEGRRGMGPNVLRGSLCLPCWEWTEDRPGPKQGDQLENSCRNQVRDGGGLGQGPIDRRVGSCWTGGIFWK